MSTSPEADFDLEKLFLPAWAKEPPQSNRFAKFEGEPERRDDRRGDRGDRRNRPQRGPGLGPARGPAARGAGAGDRPRGPRPGGPPHGRDRGAERRQETARPAAAARPLPEVQVTFTAEDHGVDLLARQIRMTGRAYPLFDIAQLVLQKPERHTVTFSVRKKPDGTVVQPIFICALDETLWLSEDDAVRHVLDRHFATFYQPERTKIDPPKGVYTFVAQCGMSGVILGPPNYHDYQNQLRRVHAERFARMPFDAFKARVRIVKDEEVVKKWIDEQSWKIEYNCLNLPEPLKLPNLEEVTKHFRQVHLANIIKPVETVRLTGQASRNLRDRELMRLLRQRWEEQKKFPLQIATTLSQQFAARGLQFFKVNKTVTHVAVARPHYLDVEATPVSEGVRRIVEFINATPKCTHKQLLKALAPAAAATAPAAPAPEAAPPAEGAAPTDGGQPVAAAVPAAVEPTPEMAAVMTDLHWLIHQGHVIEFANGLIETAKKPLPKPPPKPAKPEGQPGTVEAAGGAAPASATPEAAAATVNAPAAESPPAPGDSASAAEPVAIDTTATSPGATASTAETQPAG
jgi:hypothetical protein